MNNNHIKQLVLVISILIITLASFASYAYFTADVQGNDTATNNVITTGNMEITYEDGNVIGTTNNMIPGDSIEKHFSVKNTGTVDTVYDIYLNNIANTFNTKSDLVYEIVSTNGANINETICPDENTKIVSAVQIGVGQTHNYTLRITFKNLDKVQDDNQDKSFSAKVELVEGKPTLAMSMQKLALNGATDLEYDGVDTLGVNGTEDNNLRYVGATPNNYVYFNCDTTNPSDMNDSTCEKWRIIGLFNNIEDNNGNVSSRVKIIRDQSLGNYSWDSTATSINAGYGINQWGASGTYEGADLMRELNTDYLGNITVGTDSKWYNGSNNSKTANMPSKTLNSNAQDMIQEVKWNTGSNGSNEDSTWTTKNMYTYERSENTGKICSSGTYCNDSVERTTSWIGKVALMYPSDYGYATVGGTTTNKETCLNTTLHDWDGSGVSDCKNNSWLKPSSWAWILSPRAISTYARYVFYVDSLGSVYTDIASRTRVVRPAVFLQSSIHIAEGNGSSEMPYKLTM
jgi:hypothetical protein